MKVSRREFGLLILLLCAGVGYLLYAFVYSPMLLNIAVANENLKERQLRLSSYEQMVAQYDIEKLQTELQTKIDEIEAAAKPLLPYIDDGEITTFINQITQAQNIHIYKVQFEAEELYDTAMAVDAGVAMTYPLQQAASVFRSVSGDAQAYETSDAVGDAAADTTENTAPTEQDQIPTVVNRLTVGIQLSSVTYQQLSGFMKQLEATERAILINSLDISEESGGNLKATLVYSFMQADKLTDADQGLAEVAQAQLTGKANPFVSG